LALLLVVKSSGLAGTPPAPLQVCLVSLVLAFCLFVIGMYIRGQDESLASCQLLNRRASQVSLWLREPTAPRHWRRFWVSRRQRSRIVYSRLCGGGCVAAGLLLM